MSHCLSRERLEQVLGDSDQPSAADYQALERHTEACAACQGEQLLRDAEMERWRELLDGAEEGAPKGVPTYPEGKPELVSYEFPPSTLTGYLGQLGEYHLLKSLGAGAMG